MSTITPTAAHKEMRRQIVYYTSPEEGAQLIADSEARACAEIRDDFAKLVITSAQLADNNVGLRQERDQLRAAFPQILAGLGNGAFCTPDVSVEFIKAIPNEVAEVVAQLRDEVERLKGCCDQTSKLCGKFITEDDGTDLIPNSARIANALTRLAARAERAEAELAAERARHSGLVPLLARWLKMADDCNHELAEIGYSEYNITVGLLCDTRAAIDAAMKEGAK
jgi:hypothetical protein